MNSKSYTHLYFLQLKRDWKLVATFLLSIWIIISTQCEIGLIPCCMSDFISKKVNGILFSICSSYVAGYVFYFLTVTIPYVRNYSAVYREIVELFRAMVDSFRDMSGELCGGDWMDDDTLKNKAIDELLYRKENCSLLENKKIESIEHILFDYVVRIDSLLSQLTDFYYLMEPRTKKLLTEVKTSKSFQRCRMFKRCVEYLDRKKSEELVNGIVNNNRLIVSEYSLLKDK